LKESKSECEKKTDCVQKINLQHFHCDRLVARPEYILKENKTNHNYDEVVSTGTTGMAFAMEGNNPWIIGGQNFTITNTAMKMQWNYAGNILEGFKWQKSWIEQAQLNLPRTGLVAEYFGGKIWTCGGATYGNQIRNRFRKNQ
jgi:hypothetical protein